MTPSGIEIGNKYEYSTTGLPVLNRISMGSITRLRYIDDTELGG
jgi:hypothetical protein